MKNWTKSCPWPSNNGRSPVVCMFFFNKKGGESITPTLPSLGLQDSTEISAQTIWHSLSISSQAPVVQTTHLRASAAPHRATWCARRDANIITNYNGWSDHHGSSIFIYHMKSEWVLTSCVVTLFWVYPRPTRSQRSNNIKSEPLNSFWGSLSSLFPNRLHPSYLYLYMSIWLGDHSANSTKLIEAGET